GGTGREEGRLGRTAVAPTSAPRGTWANAARGAAAGRPGRAAAGGVAAGRRGHAIGRVRDVELSERRARAHVRARDARGRPRASRRHGSGAASEWDGGRDGDLTGALRPGRGSTRWMKPGSRSPSRGSPRRSTCAWARRRVWT